MASKVAKARQLAAERPANSMVFDLLAGDGDDLRRRHSGALLFLALWLAVPAVVGWPSRLSTADR